MSHVLFALAAFSLAGYMDDRHKGDIRFGFFMLTLCLSVGGCLATLNGF